MKSTNHMGVDRFNQVVTQSRRDWMAVKKGIESEGGRSRTMRERDGSVTLIVNSLDRVGDRPAVVVEIFNW